MERAVAWAVNSDGKGIADTEVSEKNISRVDREGAITRTCELQAYMSWKNEKCYCKRGLDCEWNGRR